MANKQINLKAWDKNHAFIMAVQGESESRTVNITILDAAGIPIDLTGSTVKYYIIKSDGNKIFDDAIITDSTNGNISFNLGYQATTLEGNAECQILITKSDNTTLKIVGLTINIQPSNLENAIESTSEFSTLVIALNNVQLSIDKVNQAVIDVNQALVDTNTAITNAEAATSSTVTATNAANIAADLANAAAINADTATSNVNAAIADANSTVTNLVTNTNNTVSALVTSTNTNTNTAVGNAETATTEANTAADRATAAAIAAEGVIAGQLDPAIDSRIAAKMDIAGGIAGFDYVNNVASNASFISDGDSAGLVRTYTCTTTGTVHQLVGIGSNGKFLADANFVGGDTFTIGTTAGNVTAKTATTQNGAALDDSYFVSGKWVNFTYDGTNLNFKSGGGTTIEVFNFKLFIQTAQPTAEKAGDVWINHALATDFNNIVLDDAVKVSYTNGSLMLIVDDTNNGYDNVTQNKKVNGTNIPFTSHRDTVNDTTLPWQAGSLNKSGNIIDIKRKYPLVYSRLNDVLDLETASVWDGTQWVLVSQQGSYLAVGTTGTPYSNLYNRTGSFLSLHSGIPSFPAAAVNCVNDSHDGINVIYGLNSSPWAVETVRSGDSMVKDSFAPHTLEAVYDAFYTHSRNRLFLVHAHHVDVYNTTSGLPVYLSTLPISTGNTYYGGDVSPNDSEFIITGSATPFIWRFKLSTLAQLANPTTLPTGMCHKGKYNPDGNFVAVRMDISPFILCYHIVSDTQWDKIANPSTLPSGSSNAEGIVFTPNSGHLIIADYTASKIWFYTYSISGLVNVTSFSRTLVAALGINFDGTKIGVGLISDPWFAWYSLNGTTLTPLANPTAMPTSRINSLDFLN